MDKLITMRLFLTIKEIHQSELYPSECAKVIVRDLAGNITVDKNTAYVTPGTRAAGYDEPGLVGGIEHSSGFATGTIGLRFLIR